jgi:hypothetical protein
LTDPKTYRFGLTAALLLAASPALAQVYSWKDPTTGQSKFSNIPPPWYSRSNIVRGPRVVATIGDRVIDDTALRYEDRLLLSGKSREYIDQLRLQKSQQPPGTQDDNRRPADTTWNRAGNARNRGS